MEQCWAGEPSRRPLLGAILPVLESIQAKAESGYRKSPQSQSSDSEPRATSPVEQRQSRNPTTIATKDNMVNGKSPRLNNNHNNNNNNALALLEPNNQRGEVASPIFVPSRRKKQHKAVLRTPKHPGFPMTNFFHTSACSNLYIQMHEF